MADTEKPSAAASEPTAEARDLDADVLRRRWDEGKASGPARPLHIEHTIAAARTRRKASSRK